MDKQIAAKDYKMMKIQKIKRKRSKGGVEIQYKHFFLKYDIYEGTYKGTSP